MIVAIANHKGGTGKTTTAQCLGVHLAEGGYRVLMVDVDPQGSLTGACGVADAPGRSLAEVLGDTDPGALSIADVVRPLDSHLHLAPAANVSLSAAESAIATRPGGIFLLRDALAAVADEYDAIFIDCPPGRGAMMVNALAAAHGVLAPTRLSKRDLDGLRIFLLETMARIKEHINPALSLVGIVPTFYRARTRYHRGNLRALQEYGLPILQPIGESIRVEEAGALNQTILTYEPDNPQALAYRELGRQVEKWLNDQTKP